jgi:hypothetical protein
MIWMCRISTTYPSYHIEPAKGFRSPFMLLAMTLSSDGMQPCTTEAYGSIATDMQGGFPEGKDHHPR